MQHNLRNKPGLKGDLTVNRCPGYSSSIERQLHRQTNDCGEDAPSLSQQHWVVIIHCNSRQQLTQ